MGQLKSQQMHVQSIGMWLRWLLLTYSEKWQKLFKQFFFNDGTVPKSDLTFYKIIHYMAFMYVTTRLHRKFKRFLGK